MSKATMISDAQLLLDLDWLLEEVNQDRATSDILLSKALFKLDTFKKASRTNLASLVIDTFNDTAGIDLNQTTADFDAASGLIEADKLSFTYTLLIPPYGTRPDSANELADNILPTSSPTHSGWVGWQRTSPQILIDLQNPIKISGVKIYYLVYQSSNIYSPGKILVKGSDDATEWNNIGELTVDPITTTGTYWAWVPASCKYRYLHITVEYRNNWVYLGEIQVLPEKSMVVSKAEKLIAPPTAVFVTADEDLPTEDSKILYYASRDGGVTWSVIPVGEKVSLQDQPLGTILKIKAELFGNARLKAWAFGWL